MAQVSGCNEVPFMYDTSVGVYGMNSILRGMPVVVDIGVISKNSLITLYPVNLDFVMLI